MNTEIETTDPARGERIQTIRNLFLLMIWVGYRQHVQLLADHGLTHPQFITLASLEAHGNPVSMHDLSEVTLQDAPTTTGVVDRLVKMGFVQRTRDHHDRRVVLVKTTSRGMALIQHIKRSLHQQDSFGFTAMNDDDLAKMENLINQMLAVQLRYFHEEVEPDLNDLEAMKLYLREFSNDPIGFMKSQKMCKGGS